MLTGISQCLLTIHFKKVLTSLLWKIENINYLFFFSHKNFLQRTAVCSVECVALVQLEIVTHSCRLAASKVRDIYGAKMNLVFGIDHKFVLHLQIGWYVDSLSKLRMLFDADIDERLCEERFFIINVIQRELYVCQCVCVFFFFFFPLLG